MHLATCELSLFIVIVLPYVRLIISGHEIIDLVSESPIFKLLLKWLAALVPMKRQ
jgi:hypothetical protein